MVEPRKEDQIEKQGFYEDEHKESDEDCVVANEHSSDDEEFDLVAQIEKIERKEEDQKRRQIESEVFGGDLVRKTKNEGGDNEPWITSLEQIHVKKRNSLAINSLAGTKKDQSAYCLTSSPLECKCRKQAIVIYKPSSIVGQIITFTFVLQLANLSVEQRCSSNGVWFS